MAPDTLEKDAVHPADKNNRANLNMLDVMPKAIGVAAVAGGGANLVRHQIDELVWTRYTAYERQLLQPPLHESVEQLD